MCPSLAEPDCGGFPKRIVFSYKPQATKKFFGVAVFQKYGLGCIGCAAAHFENLEAGAKVHGFDPDAMVDDINALIED